MPGGVDAPPDFPDPTFPVPSQERCHVHDPCRLRIRTPSSGRSPGAPSRGRSGAAPTPSPQPPPPGGSPLSRTTSARVDARVDALFDECIAAERSRAWSIAGELTAREQADRERTFTFGQDPEAHYASRDSSLTRLRAEARVARSGAPAGAESVGTGHRRVPRRHPRLAPDVELRGAVLQPALPPGAFRVCGTRRAGAFLPGTPRVGLRGPRSPRARGDGRRVAPPFPSRKIP